MKEMRDGWMADDASILGISFECSRIDGYKTGQRLEVRRKRKKRDGSETEKVEKTFVAHDFCPWCGKGYGLDAEKLIELVSDFAKVDIERKRISINEKAEDLSNRRRSLLVRLKHLGFAIQFAIA